MSEGYVDLDKIGQVLVREDGKQVVLNCRGKDAGEYDILIEVEALLDLITNLQIIHRSAEIRRETFRPIKVQKLKFRQRDPLLTVSHLACVVRPEAGQIDLQIESIEAPPIQVSFGEKHAKFLFESLLQVYNPDIEKPS
jgi:hypothetical protein